MNDAKLIRAFENHAGAINRLDKEFKAIQKILDKTYVQSLTHVMMWDVLFTLMEEKGLFTRDQFDAALKELSDKTKAAMEADHKRRDEVDAAAKVTVVSDQPAIPVIKT